MNDDDFLLDQIERSQRDQTRRRRLDRLRRRHVYALTGMLLIVALILGLPSLISHSAMGRSMLVKAIGEYGLEGNVDSMRVGWLTPLRVSGLKIQGGAGSEVIVDQLDMDLTVTDLMRSSSEYGQVTLRGLTVSCLIDDGWTSLEEDLWPLLESPDQASAPTALVKVQDISIAVTDIDNGRTWTIAQSNAEVDLTPDRTEATFAGVLTEPSGSGGSLQGSVSLGGAKDPSRSAWELDINSESLPLSVMTLVRRRFPNSAASIPRSVQGDATGGILIAGTDDGATQATIRELRVRNLTASDPGSRVWSNGLATIDGNLVLAGDRVIGRHLRASTDFASATVDGAFSRTFSLVGANDNPLRWLEAIDGTATAEIDLAALERSLPGLLPLREEAQLVSGRVFARVDSSPESGLQRSELNVRSDALRARSRGRAVVIDPIELVATVSSDQGTLTAEQFRWTSAFGTAVGQGSSRAGSADFEIDFGRLSSMLRPIIAVSETSLAGAARGSVAWNSSANNVWRLTGSGNASNLLITLPSGRSLKRPSVRGQVEAVGRWGSQALEELTSANVTLASVGLDLNAELTNPVQRPSSSVPMPFRVRGQGRIETLHDALGPWLPEELSEAAGGFTLSAAAEVSTLTARLTSAAIELNQPQLAYRDRFYTQPNIKIHFDGDYAWPSNDFFSRSLTVAGDAFSLAAKGSATAEHVEMDIKWRAKLERIQGSVRKRIATRPGSLIQQVGYRSTVPIETEDWLVMGDCGGSVSLNSRDRFLDIDLETTGTNFALVQPPQASARSQTVGPPRPGAMAQANPRGGARVVWSEPNLKLDGSLSYHTTTGEVVATAMQVAGDWFATTLSGRAVWNESRGDVRLDGPAQLKMDEVARRLASLADVDIRAEGIQQTPLEIRVQRRPDETIALAIAANLGWEAGEVAGVRFGPASIPVRLDETSVTVSPSRIPVDQGNLYVSGQVNYRPGPLWMRVDPGVVGESIRLTPQMTDRWLKYVAPLVANSTHVEGVIGAELDQAVIVFDRPEQSRVTGRLNIGGVRLNAGPLAQQIIGGVAQLKAIADPLAGQASPPAATRLVTIPAQTVQFSVEQGVVSHDRLFFEVDRAQIVTSGQVTLNGGLNMIAQIPLDARWLGRDLQGLAGQPVTLPIDGTLSRPSLDSAGVRQVVTQLGIQAAQSTAESYLQQQLNRGLERIFGR